MRQAPVFSVDLCEVEDARLRALESGDCERVEAVLASDFIFVHSNGRIDDRNSYLNMLVRGEVRYIECCRETMKAVRTTARTGLLLSRLNQRVEYRGERLQIDALSVAGFRNEKGGWRIVSLQSTPVVASAVEVFYAE